MSHNIIYFDIVPVTQVSTQSDIGLVLGLRVRVLAIIEIDQLNSNSKIVDRVAPFPDTLAGVPGPVAVFNVLDNLAIFTNGVMGADLGAGLVEPINDALQIAIGRRVDHHCGDIIGTAALVEIGRAYPLN